MSNQREVILVVSGRVVKKNSKVDWPDLNYPGSGLTVLRTIHDVDYKNKSVQLDGKDGPWFKYPLPDGVAFYEQC